MLRPARRSGAGLPGVPSEVYTPTMTEIAVYHAA